MSTVLVTGNAGFIGSHLVEELLRQGERVRVLDNVDPLAHRAASRHTSPRGPSSSKVICAIAPAWTAPSKASTASFT